MRQLSLQYPNCYNQVSRPIFNARIYLAHMDSFDTKLYHNTKSALKLSYFLYNNPYICTTVQDLSFNDYWLAQYYFILKTIMWTIKGHWVYDLPDEAKTSQ